MGVSVSGVGGDSLPSVCEHMVRAEVYDFDR